MLALLGPTRLGRFAGGLGTLFGGHVLGAGLAALAAPELSQRYRYRMVRLEATTYGGQILDFDNPPEGEGFYFAEEATTDLPKVLYDQSGFQLEDGHPDLPYKSPTTG